MSLRARYGHAVRQPDLAIASGLLHLVRNKSIPPVRIDADVIRIWREDCWVRIGWDMAERIVQEASLAPMDEARHKRNCCK